ncbi:hypothetical protein FC093_19750 [Ilyomonas limi]|uniref:Uncharacterized protein n=1 Tax=Ilyomonas limi TaxID=2575867 RepID=A0A4U3KVF2_9BACT|nr:hypothetical protein [Ilyomonas limi]TKK65554.1 hypothetical protein FC093_19750 [Ilyomonas limi]
MLPKKLLFFAAAVIAVASAINAFKIPFTRSSHQNESKHKTAFRQLNKNRKMDEDLKQPVEARINNPLQQMTIEEKTGMMFINDTV